VAKTRLNVRVDETTAEAARRRAQERDVSVNRYIEELVRQGVPVHNDPYARAAALLHLLLHVQRAGALRRAMYASAVAYAHLVASGLDVATSPERVRDPARLVKTGQADVRAVAAEPRCWSL
jgi:hypothetical protein